LLDNLTHIDLGGSRDDQNDLLVGLRLGEIIEKLERDESLARQHRRITLLIAERLNLHTLNALYRCDCSSVNDAKRSLGEHIRINKDDTVKLIMGLDGMKSHKREKEDIRARSEKDIHGTSTVMRDRTNSCSAELSWTSSS
jgi:hypothetical protein